MERELDRIRCLGDDGSTVFVVEIQHVDHRETAAGERTYPGARRWELAAGGQVRRIDRDTFEVVATGELLVRDGG
jgi:hypothetical protein